jgi:CRP-like cAMP-binding protein
MSIAEKRVHDRLVFYPGDMIFAEGDEGNWAYLIQSGKIEIFKALADGREKSLAILGPGRLFGEMALIDFLPRMASARAAEQTTLVLVSNEILQKSLQKAHPLILELLRNMSNNLRSSARQKVEQAFPDGKTEDPRPYVGKLMV